MLDRTPGLLAGPSWSPDGQWISYLRLDSSGWKVLKIRAAPGSNPEILANADRLGNFRCAVVAHQAPVTNWLSGLLCR